MKTSVFDSKTLAERLYRLVTVTGEYWEILDSLPFPFPSLFLMDFSIFHAKGIKQKLANGERRKNDRLRNSCIDLYVINALEYVSIDRLARLTAQDSREQPRETAIRGNSSVLPVQEFDRVLAPFPYFLLTFVLWNHEWHGCSTETDDPLRIVTSLLFTLRLWFVDLSTPGAIFLPPYNFHLYSLSNRKGRGRGGKNGWIYLTKRIRRSNFRRKIFNESIPCIPCFANAWETRKLAETALFRGCFWRRTCRNRLLHETARQRILSASAHRPRCEIPFFRFATSVYNENLRNKVGLDKAERFPLFPL